jgi:phosphopantethiene--protein transferase domain
MVEIIRSQVMESVNLAKLKIGTDICSVKRIEQAYERFGKRFLDRILTDDEASYVLSAERHFVHRLAGRFAAKEATVKALGTGWIGVGWKEVEIVRMPSGEPRLTLHGRAYDRAVDLGLDYFEISVSHEKEFALAFVVAYGRS